MKEIEVTGRRERRRKKVLDDLKKIKRVLEIERGSQDPTVENSLCKRLWTCRNTDYRMNEGVDT